jgi:hypothetical protein
VESICFFAEGISFASQIVRYFRQEAVKPLVNDAVRAAWPLASPDELHSATRISQLFGGENVSKQQHPLNPDERRKPK